MGEFYRSSGVYICLVGIRKWKFWEFLKSSFSRGFWKKTSIICIFENFHFLAFLTPGGFFVYRFPGCTNFQKVALRVDSKYFGSKILVRTIFWEFRCFSNFLKFSFFLLFLIFECPKIAWKWRFSLFFAISGFLPKLRVGGFCE